MRSTCLVGAVAALLTFGIADGVRAQATAPQSQPPIEAAPAAPTGDLALGTVRVPRRVMADGKALAAGTYRVRLTAEEASGRAPGATASYERYVEFVQNGQVKGREVASIVADADIAKVANGPKPAQGASRVEMLRGNEFLRVWINRGSYHYLIHLVPQA